MPLILVSPYIVYRQVTRVPGSLLAWGSNATGNLGISGSSYNYPTSVDSSEWLQVSAGANHTLGIKKDGSLWAWGSNSHGQIGIGSLSPSLILEPRRIGAATDWTMVSAGYRHSVALNSQGTAFGWGSNDQGQLGQFHNGDSDQLREPRYIGVGYRFVKAGNDSTFALKQDGTLWATGSNINDQLGRNFRYSIGNDYLTDLRQVGKARWKFVSTYSLGNSIFGVQIDGSLWGWGTNTAGQLGLGHSKEVYAPARIGTSVLWEDVQCGGGHAMSFDTSGNVFAWGSNSVGQLADTSLPRTTVSLPTKIDVADVASIALGSTSSFLRKKDGTLYSAGGNRNGELGQRTSDASAILAPISDFKFSSISAGPNHVLGLI